MDDVLDDLMRLARRCERGARVFESDPLKSMKGKLLEAAASVGESWSGSWIGHQATIYLAGFVKPTPRDVFDREWGGTGRGGHLDQTRGNWAYVEYDSVKQEILHRAGIADVEPFREAACAAREIFEHAREELLPTFDALIAIYPDNTLKEQRECLKGLKDHLQRRKIIESLMPRSFFTRDSRAASEGIREPHHLAFQGWLLEELSYGLQVGEVAKIAKYVATYLEKKHKMKGKSVARTSGKIFIGHGRSATWRELQGFIRDRIGLDYEEFNRETPAGLSNKERLLNMVDSSCFAFLVMTAEDDQVDGSKRSRQNVVHEAGLFQGRYGLERAIIMLEEGCDPFSNIDGLGHITFPKGNIKAAFEEVRQVLEREKII